jgi:hypothetical protein
VRRRNGCIERHRVSLVEPGPIRTPAVDKTMGDVEARIGALPPEGAARYGAMLRKLAQCVLAREPAASPPVVVAAAVPSALTDRHPRARYRAGRGARLLTAIPRQVRDRMLSGVAGIPQRFAGALGD